MNKVVFIRGVALSLLCGILWGFSGSCGEFLFHGYETPVITIIWVRGWVASALYLLLVFVTPGQRTTFGQMIRSKEELKKLFIYGVFGLLACQMFFMFTIDVTNAGTATILERLSLIMILVWTAVTLRKKPEFREVAGIILALASVFLISTHGNPAELVLPVLGIVFGLLDAFFCSVMTVYPKQLLDKWGSICVTAGGTIISTIVLTPFVLPLMGSFYLDLPGWLALFGMTITGTYLSFIFYFQGVKDIGPMLAALLASIEPVAATIISWVWLGTTFPPIDLIGFTLMLAMVVVVTVVPNKNKAKN